MATIKDILEAVWELNDKINALAAEQKDLRNLLQTVEEKLVANASFLELSHAVALLNDKLDETQKAVADVTVPADLQEIIDNVEEISASLKRKPEREAGGPDAKRSKITE